MPEGPTAPPGEDRQTPLLTHTVSMQPPAPAAAAWLPVLVNFFPPSMHLVYTGTHTQRYMSIHIHEHTHSHTETHSYGYNRHTTQTHNGKMVQMNRFPGQARRADMWTQGVRGGWDKLGEWH